MQVYFIINFMLKLKLLLFNVRTNGLESKKRNSSKAINLKYYF